MAGKLSVFACGRLVVAMEKITKNQLIDLVLDLALLDVGEDATDEALVAWVQQRMETVWRFRGDRRKEL